MKGSFKIISVAWRFCVRNYLRLQAPSDVAGILAIALGGVGASTLSRVGVSTTRLILENFLGVLLGFLRGI